MVRFVSRSEKGTSLVEILIAILLTALVFAGLVKASIMATSKNVENVLRDEAVTIAEQSMTEARNLPFNTLTFATEANLTGATPPGTATVLRNFKGQTGFQFTRTMVVTPLGNPAPNNNNNQVVILVTWTWKGNTTYQHRITTIVRRPVAI